MVSQGNQATINHLDLRTDTVGDVYANRQGDSFMNVPGHYMYYLFKPLLIPDLLELLELGVPNGYCLVL